MQVAYNNTAMSTATGEDHPDNGKLVASTTAKKAGAMVNRDTTVMLSFLHVLSSTLSLLRVTKLSDCQQQTSILSR
jgi:hypothetical protein